jgi:hypothetical protein
MSILIKGLGHEKLMLHLTKNDLFDEVSNLRSSQNGQMSFKMAMV